MKTFLELELKTGYEKALVRMYGREALQSHVFKKVVSTWVAEIPGFDQRGPTRRFLSHNKDYSRVNNSATQGVYAEFILESGKVYEVKNYMDRYFCRVDDECNIIKISGTEAQAWLNPT